MKIFSGNSNLPLARAIAASIGTELGKCTVNAFPDGETFVALLQLDDGVENPLPGFPEFREFLEGVEASRAEPANVQPMTVIGSYRMF